MEAHGVPVSNISRHRKRMIEVAQRLQKFSARYGHARKKWQLPFSVPPLAASPLEREDDQGPSRRQLADAFEEARRGMLRALEEEGCCDLFALEKMPRRSEALKIVGRNSKGTAGASSSFGKVEVCPPGGTFEQGSVTVSMSSPEGDAHFVEFETLYYLPAGWQRRLHPEPLRQPLCRYRRPIVIEQVGQWVIRVRLRDAMSNCACEWETFNFNLESTLNRHVPVLRCIIRTKLDRLSRRFDTSSYFAFENAMESALGLPSVAVRVLQAKFSWPHVDAHLAIYSSEQKDGIGASHLHPLEEIMHRLHDFSLVPILVDLMRKAGVNCTMIAVVGGSVRSLVFQEGTSNPFHSTVTDTSNTLLLLSDYRRLRSLFSQSGRVNSNAQFAHENQYFEAFLKLPTALFDCVLLFLFGRLSQD